jgi:hypothetical protein
MVWREIGQSDRSRAASVNALLTDTSALPNVADTFTTGFRKIAGFPKLDMIDQRLKTNGDVDISIAPLEGRQRRRQSVQPGLERRH